MKIEDIKHIAMENNVEIQYWEGLERFYDSEKKFLKKMTKRILEILKTSNNPEIEIDRKELFTLISEPLEEDIEDYSEDWILDTTEMFLNKLIFTHVRTDQGEWLSVIGRIRGSKEKVGVSIAQPFIEKLSEEKIILPFKIDGYRVGKDIILTEINYKLYMYACVSYEPKEIIHNAKKAGQKELGAFSIDDSILQAFQLGVKEVTRKNLNLIDDGSYEDFLKWED